MSIPKVASLRFFNLPLIGQFITRLLSLLILMLGFCSPSFAESDKGFALLDNLVGSYGEASSFLKKKVTDLLNESGITAAATEAKTVLDGLGERAVPVIDDLSNPVQDKAQEAIAEAMSKVELSTRILKKMTGEGAKAAIDFITNSPLFEDADFGITTLTGRIRVYRKGTEVSLCRTIVGPLGSVIITGISNSKQLCNFPDSRMENPTKSLLAFTYTAAGHTYIRTNHVIIPNLAADLTLLPAPIAAETYVKTVGDQWVQIRLAGADPKSLTLQAKFEVGVKANYSYVVDVEAEGEAALKIIDLKPLYAAEVIRSTGEVMLNKATALGLSMEVANLASDASAILKAGIQHLSDIEPNYADGFGMVSIDVKLTGGIGPGVWDTAISLISANSTFNLTAPLAAFVEMNAGLLEEFLDVGIAMADVNLKLGTAVLERNQSALVNYRAGVQTVTNAFFEGVLTELLKMSTQITSIESTFKLALLGDADKESTSLYESGLKLPLGVISTNLQKSPNPLGGAFEAVSYLLLSAVDPDAVITEQTWADLEAVIVPGIEFTFLVWNPVTLNMSGLREADLLKTIKGVATIRNILVSLLSSSANESLADLRSAIKQAIEAVEDAANDVVIGWLNETEIVKSLSLGANGSIGAEAVAELGASIGIEGRTAGSLFLLVIDHPFYQIPEEGLLASASVPIDFSVDAGVSAGEGVELTVDAGGKVSMNLLELTVKHWDGNLPAAALMEVAGFSVLEFDGVTNPDKSFAGSGFLMLPMGGIVFAEFSVDRFGNVMSGRWSGGIDLGPLGKFSWLEGELDNEGLNGLINVGWLGAKFNANFILNSSGLLLGNYDGALNIADHALTEVNVYLGGDGKFSGRYRGEIRIGGFNAISDLSLNNDEFAGSSSLNILGSELSANDLVISRAGDVLGTFTGTIQVGTHLLSEVSLQVVNGGLIGTARMGLPGLANAQVELRIIDGEVMAYYRGDLLNGLISQASFGIGESEIIVSASLNTSQFPGLSAQVLERVSAAAELAQAQLENAQQALEDAQRTVDQLEADIADANAQLIADLEEAQQTLLDAEQAEQAALDKLNAAIAKIDKLNSSYEGLLIDAQIVVDNAQTAVDRASGSVAYYKTKIRNLDSWYNGLSSYNKAVKLAYYTKQRTKLIALRVSAQAELSTLQVVLTAAQLELDLLNSELANLLNPLDITREGLQITYDKANEALRAANDALANITIDPDLSVIFASLDVARGDLREAQALVNRLSGSMAMVEYAANQGAENAFSVLSANFKTEMSSLLQGDSFSLDARVVYMGQMGQITLLYDQSDIAVSFHQALQELDAGAATLNNSDVAAPTVVAKLTAQWAFDRSLIQLVADDNYSGLGVASITYRASGAQALEQVSVAGNRAFALINVEGMTALSFFATDINGNVSETTTVNVNIDNSGPQISVSSGVINAGVYEVAISAEDLLGSGISYLAMNASGAEYITETIEQSDSMKIALTQSGATTLFITAVDVAGNVSKLEFDVAVPDLSNDPALISADNPSSSGGSLSMLWLLILTFMLCLRRLPSVLNCQQKFKLSFK